jgi:hypothetical protein
MDNVNQSVTTGVSSTTASIASNCITNSNPTAHAASIPSLASNGMWLLWLGLVIMNHSTFIVAKRGIMT